MKDVKKARSSCNSSNEGHFLEQIRHLNLNKSKRVVANPNPNYHAHTTRSPASTPTKRAPCHLPKSKKPTRGLCCRTNSSWRSWRHVPTGARFSRLGFGERKRFDEFRVPFPGQGRGVKHREITYRSDKTIARLVGSRTRTCALIEELMLREVNSNQPR